MYIYIIVISIFHYSNYRFFLRDFLIEKKKNGDHLTYDALGQAVGFKSKGFLTQILQGKTNLPLGMIGPLAQALQLGKKESNYFSILIKFNQAKTASRRSEYFLQIQKEFRAKPKSLGMDHFEYYQKWYYSAIRAILSYYPFKGDFSELGKQLEPAITSFQAKRAIQLLIDLELINLREDGFYHLVEKAITSGEDFIPHAVIHYQKQTMDLAKAALENIQRSHRNASTLTLSLSQKGYEATNQKLKALRQDLTEISRFDQNVDRVMQINLHAFPLTKLSKERDVT